MALNLIYKIKRFFQGESGVVEIVEPQDPFNNINYLKDDHGNLPQRITFRNPLCELIAITAPLIYFGPGTEEYTRTLSDPDEPLRVPVPTHIRPLYIYKKYYVGDKFP